MYLKFSLAKHMEKPDLVLWSAKDLNRRLRATVHRSLKMGYTRDTAAALKLKEGMGILLFTNGRPPKANDLYMKLLPGRTEESYRINKAGSYYYAATRGFFEELGKQLSIDFEGGGISYDMTEIEFDGERYYHLVPRIGKPADEDSEEGLEDSLTNEEA